MAFFSKTPEEIAARDAEKHARALQAEEDRRLKEALRRAEEFAKTPAGQARAARNAGSRLFQLSLPLGTTSAFAIPLMFELHSSSTKTEHASILDSVEAEGWRLEHAAYVYEITGSVSRDKLFASGQEEAVRGAILGVYIFRAQ
jgi:hypothetical protein